VGLGALTYLLPPLFTETMRLTLALRVAIAAAVLGGTGAALGLFFPLGMVRFGEAGKPWFWAVNAFFGTAAAVLSLALAMEYGHRVLGLAAALIYATAWAALALPAGSAAPAGTDAGIDGNPRP
jgi:hypothetical protein